MRIHVDVPDEFINQVVSRCFPEYRGRKIVIDTDIPSTIQQHWTGGSKNTYAFYEPATDVLYRVQDNHPVFGAYNPRVLDSRLPPGLLLVCHKIFCGKDLGIVIYGHKTDFPQLLPVDTGLNDEEKRVLCIVRGLKSFAREQEAQRYMTLKEYNTIKQRLIDLKYLNRNGSINARGRNVITDVRRVAYNGELEYYESEPVCRRIRGSY